jgi:YVTN family beta-propeller protein
MGFGRRRKLAAHYSIAGRTVTEGKRIRLTDNVGNAGAYPAGIALTHDARKLYVVGNLDDTLYVVNTQTSAVVKTIAVGHLPFGVALSQDGSLAFVSNWGQETVSVVDTQSNKVLRTVKVGLHPGAIAASPTRNEIYVANSDSDSVSVLDSRTGSICARSTSVRIRTLRRAEARTRSP